MNRMLLGLQSAYKRLPWCLRPCIALIIALPLGLFLPQVLGGGQNLIQLAESTQSRLRMISVLLACKLMFTCTSFGSGTPGGIFMPILAVGALSGSLFGIASAQIGLPKEYIPFFAVCGMAGTLSSVVKAPITSILLTAEMTGSLMHLFPVAACVLIALLVSDLLKIQPIYEALLERFVGNRDVRAKEEKENLFELPVEMGSLIANKRIKEVDLPQGCLILVILRGTKELVPNGNTKMLPSDYLLILCKEENSNTIKETMRELCRFG